MSSSSSLSSSSKSSLSSSWSHHVQYSPVDAQVRHHALHFTLVKDIINIITSITTVIIMIIKLIIIIIIAFKGAVCEFLLSTHCAANTSPTHMLKWPGRSHVQITCNTLSAYHMQLVVLRATWYEGTAQLLSLNRIYLSFISLPEPLTDYHHYHHCHHQAWKLAADPRISVGKKKMSTPKNKMVRSN